MYSYAFLTSSLSSPSPSSSPYYKSCPYLKILLHREPGGAWIVTLCSSIGGGRGDGQISCKMDNNNKKIF